MSFINRIIGDLRDKRILALAAAGLLAALIAVPVLLSKGSSSPAVVAQTPAIGQTAPSGLPVVNAVSSPAGGALAGPSHDPFAQPKGTSTTTTSGTTPSSGSTGTAGTSTTPSSGTSTAGTGTSTGGAPSTTPTTTIPTGTPTPAPTGLTSTQSYEVKLAITNSAGGLDTIDPLERLSVLPSKQQPLLVELGVLKGGGRVLFALEPGARVSGGTCIPGPIDCEIVSLSQDQTVTLSEQTANGTQTVALFAVTGITAADHASVAAANEARNASSAAGQRLLDESTSGALSLFRYESSLGAIVDERNLGVS